jgi:two-component system chemotaxis response regulator CheB
MPADFIFSFAERLDKLLKMPVKVTSDGMRIEPGNIYILAGDTNTKIVRKSKYDIVFQFTSSQYKEYNNPSIDCMMESVAEVYGSKALAIILTGMGRDGCFGISKIYDKGGYTIAQDEKTSIVYGMPRAVKEAGVAKQVLSLKDMPSFVVSALA